MYGNFNACYEVTRAYEGGRVDNKKDPGGRTNKGVTQNTYNAWLKMQGRPAKDVYQITDAETKQIYQDEYWKPSRCDELPRGLDMIVFDTAINSGVNRAGVLLQAALNAKLPPNAPKLDVDGRIGSKTIEATDRFGTAALRDLIDDYCNRRLAFLKAIRHKKTGELLWTAFGKGWGARVGNVRTVGKSMLTPEQPQVVPNTKLVQLDTGAKAYDDAPISGNAVTTETAAKATGAAAIGSGVMEAVQGVASTFQGLSDVASFFRYAFIALTVGLAVYSLIVAFRSSRAKLVHTGEATVPLEEADAAMAGGISNVVPA